MPVSKALIGSAAAAVFVFTSSAPASAFCGVIERSATTFKTSKSGALARAQIAVNGVVKKLRKEHGAKVVLESPKSSCVGGKAATCTVSLGFCVNP